MLLDTTVVSEAMRVGADPAVLDWLRRQRVDKLYLAAPSLAELLVGVEALPAGHRKETFSQGLDHFVGTRIQSRVLPFDRRAATVYAKLLVDARRRGAAISVVDGQIAAIARVHRLSVASRDTTPFLAAGVSVIDPWHKTA